MSGGALTAFDFQLVVLRRMADFQGDLVRDALRELDTTLTAMRESNRRWQAMVRSPRRRGALARYRSVLGPPLTTGRRRLGDFSAEALAWQLPLWPELRFEVMTAPGGEVWHEGLVRAPGAAAPPLRTAADLVPWSATVAEVAAAFAPATPMEGSAPTRSRLAFTVEEAPLKAEFTYGLLQRLLP